MKDIKLTGNENDAELIEQLIALRLHARKILRLQSDARDTREEWEGIRVRTPIAHEATLAQGQVEQVDEYLLQIRFVVIDIGKYLMSLCAALDRKAPRSAILDALEVNQAHRDSENMRKYGDKTIHIIGALALENSATKDTSILTKPLQWCQTMAFNHALQTNEKLDRAVHEEANKMFGDAFGEYQERPLIERLAGQGVKR